MSTDETIGVSADQTTYYGGTVAATAAATGVLAGDCKQAVELLPEMYIDC
jgi:hypothetical protein